MALITLPFACPIATGLGLDGFWLGVLPVRLVEIGAITPPMGINLLAVVAASQSRIAVLDVARGISPCVLPELPLLRSCWSFLASRPDCRRDVASDMAKSALRVLEIMEFIAGREGGATHTTIARGLGIPKSSLTALLGDLQSSGYLVADPDTGRYVLGAQVLTLAHGYLRTLNIVRIGSRVVELLFRRFDEFAALAIPKGDEYVIVAAQAPAVPLAHSLQIGERGPLYCSATGKAILSALPEAEAEAWLTRMVRPRVTPRTRTGVAEIMAELQVARAAGCAVAREEAILGITAIAAPVLNAAGQPIGALSVAGPTARIASEREAEIADVVRVMAAEMSAEFGWRRAPALA